MIIEQCCLNELYCTIYLTCTYVLRCTKSELCFEHNQTSDWASSVKMPLQIKRRIFRIHLKSRKHSINISFFSQTLTIHGTAEEGGNHLYSSLPLPPAQGHPEIYLQLCMWDDYHCIFNRIACNYQIATRWGFPPLGITMGDDDGELNFACLIL